MSERNDIELAAEATELVYKTQVVGNRFRELPGFAVDHVFDDFCDLFGRAQVGLLKDKDDFFQPLPVNVLEKLPR